MDQKEDKLENENIKMKDQQINEQEKIIKIGELNIKMGQKRKMANIESNSGKKRPKSTIRRRPIPTELMNELFGSLPFANAFALLAKMPNGLLARNMRKMIESIKMAMKENKWNSNDRGPGLDIGEDGLIATSNGTKDDSLVRAQMPIFKFPMQTITKPLIVYYFEVQILNCSNRWFFGNGILIGYCGQQFPLEQEWLGRKNSIGIWQKRGIRIDGKITFFEDDYEYEEGRYANEIWEKDEVEEGDEEEEDMERYIDPFEDGDVIGVGIIQNPNSSLECFATCNGELMGKAELPAKFVHIQLFPAINLFDADNSVRTNFGEEEWEFKEFGDPRPSSIKGEVTMTRVRN